jgi:hypothetical protein
VNASRPHSITAIVTNDLGYRVEARNDSNNAVQGDLGKHAEVDTSSSHSKDVSEI